MLHTLENLPAGLMDRSTEAFFADGQLLALHDGKKILFKALPEYASAPFKRELKNDRPALEALESSGITDADEQLHTYVKCKYGGFNNTPDCNESGELQAEHWNCGCNGHCPLHSQMRGHVQVQHGELTSRELEVCVRIASGMPGKVIASEMGISEATYNTHKQHIFKKTGFQSNLDIAKWVTIEKLSHHAV